MAISPVLLVTFATQRGNESRSYVKKSPRTITEALYRWLVSHYCPIRVNHIAAQLGVLRTI
jgi:hypothetical protein